ncbi:MAG: hypothetical protein BTN85_1106 [Candidatus Methanohalarchaeum thermophilum]|uniref:DUF424 domain-containing protein n=1 Tax=Methanohalarchaeum thermophilum TaxID=1903181 RepID=A0A1Q6DW69_METT1|nr:MAG: hypothetical protein BTN85_1106 [Candidatus Methanohalarchaeum thermophilum]
MYMRIHEKKEETIVAVCDEKLLGKTIGEKDIEITIKREFYGKEGFSQEEIKEAMKKATIGNLVGKNSVELGIKHGFIDKDHVIEINGTPHAQMVLL